MAWAPVFLNANIDSIGMTYFYMRNYEDRVRRAAITRPMSPLASSRPLEPQPR